MGAKVKGYGSKGERLWEQGSIGSKYL